VGGLGLKDVSWGRGGRVPEADSALNCSVPERCIKYASDCSYHSTVADDLHSLYRQKYDAQDYTGVTQVPCHP
jgi:hypothetical protein